MDISGLEYFISVAETQNFTKAAQRCAITQTAMSQHIRNMEKRMGFQLFERSTRQVRLTPAGQAFYTRAVAIVKAYEQAVRDSREVASGKTGSVRVHVLGYPEAMLLLPRFRRFQERYPNVHLEVRLTGMRDLMEQLDNGLCDVAVCEALEYSRSEIAVHHIADFRLDLMCSPEHPLAKRGHITAADLQAERVTTMDLSAMPRTQNVIRRQWEAMGLSTPEISFLHGAYTHEDLALQVNLDPALLIALPEYVKSHCDRRICFIPIKDNLKFALSAVVLKQNPKAEVASLINILTNNRLSLNY